ncbi:Uncharacterised protein [Klebsiella pneumoniae]|uniref:Uncharacterized protein n=1 Tax=Klebsiella pneumoniae TaxID=573 RepID=A0A2X3CLX1_KLEPN|nr:Uncharacterised protein [Klebsiella pneumoniae]
MRSVLVDDLSQARSGFRQRLRPGYLLAVDLRRQQPPARPVVSLRRPFDAQTAEVRRVLIVAAHAHLPASSTLASTPQPTPQ